MSLSNFRFESDSTFSLRNWHLSLYIFLLHLLLVFSIDTISIILHLAQYLNSIKFA